MKNNDKKKKEVKKEKSDVASTKGHSDYQQEKTRKSVIEPATAKSKK